jgi:phage tail-like protein
MNDAMDDATDGATDGAMNEAVNAASSYLDHLPAMFRTPDAAGEIFLGRFLLAFEHVLTGLGDATVAGYPAGLAEQIAGSASYVDPQRAPLEFLDWLAGWVALSLRDDWTVDEKRRFLGRAVSMYQKRGTAAGLLDLLRAYTGDLPVVVYEFDDIPNYFQVEMSLGLSLHDPDYDARKSRRQQIAVAIIEQEKPVHTFFGFRFRDLPTMQIGVTSTVGVDTALGSVTEPAAPTSARGRSVPRTKAAAARTRPRRRPRTE